ncbi:MULTISPECIES: MBOAT family protein [unclassified Saccharopolyspora]|uniref:MBOAT family O-acyltransferase n=1 Tax=unclassified Saccharopolyspora TaxID=2646250 RepID=UPI001CD57B5D|nr:MULTISPECIES: MBOAT family protein [unclassified Saccharopolyspora]MCA1193158.1 MBOAT family protein [Saccharopolyspora sp. 6V]MCA1227867.1 MBOAT family protein [Saccharopolyspora sp. 6M]MCA1282784.1 MBOAT family protein [Saccharopolyspora sp. 7B]
MYFSTPLFLWYFLPVVLAAVLIAPRSARNAIVAVASLVFYASGAGGTTLLLLACIVVNFLAGKSLEPEAEHPHRRALLIGAVSFDLLVLVVWKYAGFATEQLATLTRWFGGDFPVLQLALPIGISFYTFHHISYVVDVYRGERPALRNPVGFVTYIAMFPQLVAGPIVRYREIADQLPQQRTHRLDDVAAGFPRFAWGLTKKVVVADTLAPMVDACFATPAEDMSFAVAWLGAIGYTVQLYFDFSGYSDMAIGLGRMLGFRLPENFARPYSSVTVTEFWRRWHMSLSRWFRDYVYIPLGGNRRGTGRTYLNLAIIFVLTGFWHGAAWTYLVWGLFHGALLVVERATGHDSAPADRWARLGRRALTLLLVVLGWVFFRAPDLGTAFTMTGHMLLPDLSGLTDLVAASVTHQRVFFLLVALVVVLLPASTGTGAFLESVRSRQANALRAAVMTAGLLYSGLLVATGSFSPFLYYQF